jgi:fumarate reductase subunit D
MEGPLLVIAFVQQAVGVLLIFNELIIFVLSAGLHKPSGMDHISLHFMQTERSSPSSGEMYLLVLKFLRCTNNRSVNNPCLEKK